MHEPGNRTKNGKRKCLQFVTLPIVALGLTTTLAEWRGYFDMATWQKQNVK